MVKAPCPDCERLVEITPTPHRIGPYGSAHWWRVVLHSDSRGDLCDGSGKMV